MTDQTKGKLPVWARIVLVMLMFLVLTFVIQLFTNTLLGIDSTDQEALKNLAGNKLLFTQASALIATLISVLTFRKYIDLQPIASLGFDKPNKASEFLWGLISAIIVIGVGTVILTISGHVKIAFNEFNFNSLAIMFFVFIIVSINEEILFRGYILNNLLTKTNKPLALLISSVLFALLHGLNPNITWLSMLNLLLAGCLLGVSYIYTKSLWFPLSLHLFWNFFQGPVLGYQVSGTITDSLCSVETIGEQIIHGGEFGFEGSIICSILCTVTIIMIIIKYKPKQVNNQ